VWPQCACCVGRIWTRLAGHLGSSATVVCSTPPECIYTRQTMRTTGSACRIPILARLVGSEIGVLTCFGEALRQWVCGDTAQFDLGSLFQQATTATDLSTLPFSRKVWASCRFAFLVPANEHDSHTRPHLTNLPGPLDRWPGSMGHPGMVAASPWEKYI
jgi:hypothetical protein